MSTKYVLFVDSSVEFTHNSNLKRMLSLLESNQLSVVSPMTEDAKTQLLEGGCFDVISTPLSPAVSLPQPRAAHSTRLR